MVTPVAKRPITRRNNVESTAKRSLRATCRLVDHILPHARQKGWLRSTKGKTFLYNPSASSGTGTVRERAEAVSGSNWEASLLEESLSRRARAVGPAYWGAGASATPPPVPPIALTGGIPDPDSLPIDELTEVSRRVLAREGRLALQYGGPQGFLGLREWVAGRLSALDGVPLGPENVAVTNGSAGALANVCETLLDEGDAVLIEAPTYPGAVRVMRALGARPVPVPLDGEGIRPDALEETLADLGKQRLRAKLLYTIPNFHNPSGVTASGQRRRQVLELTRRHGVWIVEDDAYGDIRLHGEPVPSYFALAGGQGVFRVGTFSKTLATGLRVGWVAAGPATVDALVRLRFDMGTTPWLQRVVTEYAASGLLNRHLPRVLDIYRRKRDLMLGDLARHCASFARWEVPSGGFFLWLRLDPRLDATALAEAAAQEGVASVPGDAFFPAGGAEDGTGRGFIRLAYSFVAEADIPEAIARLGRAMARALEASGAK